MCRTLSLPTVHSLRKMLTHSRFISRVCQPLFLWVMYSRSSNMFMIFLNPSIGPKLLLHLSINLISVDADFFFHSKIWVCFLFLNVPVDIHGFLCYLHDFYSFFHFVGHIKWHHLKHLSDYSIICNLEGLLCLIIVTLGFPSWQVHHFLAWAVHFDHQVIYSSERPVCLACEVLGKSASAFFRVET